LRPPSRTSCSEREPKKQVVKYFQADRYTETPGGAIGGKGQLPAIIMTKMLGFGPNRALAGAAAFVPLPFATGHIRDRSSEKTDATPDESFSPREAELRHGNGILTEASGISAIEFMVEVFFRRGDASSIGLLHRRARGRSADCPMGMADDKFRVGSPFDRLKDLNGSRPGPKKSSR